MLEFPNTFKKCKGFFLIYEKRSLEVGLAFGRAAFTKIKSAVY